MIKDILKQNGISVYAVSKGSGIPYTTLNELVNGKKNLSDCSVKTLVALASFLGLSMDALLNVAQGSQSVKVRQTWEEKRKHAYEFPVIAPSSHYDASRLHPLKQRVVNSLCEKLAKDERISSVILFGSSVNIRCNKSSDIDLLITLKPEHVSDEVKNKISSSVQELANWKADILWGDRIKKGSRIEENINRGVKII